MTDNLDKIRERIAKLLAMSEDTSSPNEAAIAARRARALMDKYQIDSFDLQGIADEFAEIGTGEALQFMALWRQGIAINVARVNDCIADYEGVYSRGKMAKRIRFKGYKQDVDMAVTMYNFLCQAITDECSKFMKGAGYTKYVASVGNSFKLACGREVAGRLVEMQTARKQENGEAGQQLMIVKDRNVQEKYGEEKYTKRTSRQHVDLEARRAAHHGYVTGRTMKIQEAVE